MRALESRLSATTVETAAPNEAVGLDEYYSEAGPDYAAWSKAFNMHFGFFRWGMNPFRREAMLEQMNLEVLDRLHIDPQAPASILDLGCGLGATLRTLARSCPLAQLTGITLVPWQVEKTSALNHDAGFNDRIHLVLGDYEHSAIAPESFDAAYALESSCHAHGADKRALLRETHRILKPGGRLVIADGFLCAGGVPSGLRARIYRKLCECWVIEDLGQLDLFVLELKCLGFHSVTVERMQLRVAPSIFHIPWVTLKFFLTEVVFGSRRMTRARWNNVIAPVLLPLVGHPCGPMMYCMVTATKPERIDG
jgi:SAM-dependent methyltransferase